MNAPDATSESRANGSQLSITFQGAPGAYSHVAARLFLAKRGKELGLPTESDAAKNLNISFNSARTFQEVFERVATGASQFGVIPLANSSVGAIMPSWELSLQYQVSFITDVYVPVHHQLIGLPNTDPQQVKIVISHPVALKQCINFLNQRPWIQPTGFWDTSGAAFHVKEANDPTIVAIAGEPAARVTGLSILAKDIEDFSHNETRFGIIAPVAVAMDAVTKNFPARPKLTCCVELDPDTVEFASFVAATIGRHNAKVSNIIPLCIPERTWQYRYILELELGSNQQTQGIWAAIREAATKARILGIYSSLRMATP
jgi:chorismate mutase / prephenate dehydratase